VEGILENLDRRKGQVLIEVAIVQVSGDDSMDLGVEFLALNDSGGGRAYADTGTGFDLGKQSDPGGRGFPSQAAISAFTGYAFRFVREDQLQVILKALKTKGNVGIVSQPLLLVNDNEKAKFETKVSEPTVTSSQGTATTNNSFGGFADATTSLDITPHISPDGYVNLEIVQTFEEFQGESAGAGIPPPKVSNSTTTKVTVPDRKTIVIGGFTRDSSTDTRRGVPGLMEIPGLGKIFSREIKRKTSSRLYLFVRPKVLSMPDFRDLRQESNEKKEDLDRLTRKSRIKAEIDERVGGKEDLELRPVPITEQK
jgi:type II secretory pathway component GspD/PulD (secretin)